MVVISQNEDTRASRVISVLFQDLTIRDAMQEGLVADAPFSSALPGVPGQGPPVCLNGLPYGVNRHGLLPLRDEDVELAAVLGLPVRGEGQALAVGRELREGGEAAEAGHLFES